MTEHNKPRPNISAYDHYGASTHEVSNQPGALADINLYEADIALREAVQREGAAWAHAELSAFGQRVGRAEFLEWGHLANKFLPEFDSHDRFGHRVDLIRFHPAYHQLLQTAIEHGLHSSPWTTPRSGAHVKRAAQFYLQSQAEAGVGCPITMTFACIPALRQQAELAAKWENKILACHYDASNRPMAEKTGLTIGMAMTEKQGGSDVRANTTTAIAIGRDGDSAAYELVGHKFFVSAPMSDAFLTLAQTENGLSCFLLPRWRPDGSKNPLQIQRLKRKMGNVSNASSETELRGALAWRVGDEGRGVRTIIEMVAMTRFDCMIGSSAGMRMAVSQAIHHCRQRKAFGKLLSEQPLMQNVLADLALESEAALALTMRLARAMDHRDDPHEDALARLVTAMGKYWICKRTPQHAYEAMECIGGSGVMEDSPMPRLFRESPVNAIWEGSGNIQCLDVLRAIEKSPEVLEALLRELRNAQGSHPIFDQRLRELDSTLSAKPFDEFTTRILVDNLATTLQAALLLQHAPLFVADAFCQSRLAASGHHHYGTLGRGTQAKAIIDRSWA